MPAWTRKPRAVARALGSHLTQEEIVMGVVSGALALTATRLLGVSWPWSLACAAAFGLWVWFIVLCD